MSTQDEIDVVQAEQFELVDATGRSRAIWALRNSGAPYLSLLDTEQRPRLTLRLDESGRGEVALWDQNGRETLVLVSSEQDGIVGIGRDGVMRLGLFVDNRGNAFMQLSDRYGHPRLEFLVDRYGRPLMGWHRRPGERYWVDRLDPARR